MDPTKPHTLAVMGARNTTDIVGKQYYAVPQYFDFVPATSATATTWNASTLAKCNLATTRSRCTAATTATSRRARCATTRTT